MANRFTGLKWGDAVELAKTCRLEVSHVWRILQGEREPGITKAAKLAIGLGLTLDELYRALYPGEHRKTHGKPKSR